MESHESAVSEAYRSGRGILPPGWYSRWKMNFGLLCAAILDTAAFVAVIHTDLSESVMLTVVCVAIIVLSPVGWLLGSNIVNRLYVCDESMSEFRRDNGY